MAFLVITYGLPLAFRLPMVKDHLSSSVISVDVEDDLKTVAQLLSRNRITGAPVVEDGTVIGILSRNDLLRAICTVPTDASDQTKEESLDKIRATKVWKVCQDIGKPLSILPDASLLEATKMMTDRKFNRLMVKGQYSSMLGIITSTDTVFSLLGCDAASALSIETSEHKFGRLPSGTRDSEDSESSAQEELCGLGSAAGVQEWMTQTGLIVMPPEMNLRDAGLLLRAAVVTGAPVIDDGRLVGVVSRNDLLTGLLSIPMEANQAEFESEIARLQALPVRELMSPSPVTITPEVSMLGAAKIMAESRLNRLLVTSAEGSDDLIGIISSTDLVFALLGCGADEADADVAIDPRRLGNLYRPGIY